MSESLGLTSHKSSCNCTGCGMLRAEVRINCAEKTAALILESGHGEIAVEPHSGACCEAIELYFSTPPERWRAPLTPRRPWDNPWRTQCALPGADLDATAGARGALSGHRDSGRQDYIFPWSSQGPFPGKIWGARADSSRIHS
jgi:hypothetical protein